MICFKTPQMLRSLIQFSYSYLGIAIPGSRTFLDSENPGILNTKSRDFRDYSMIELIKLFRKTKCSKLVTVLNYNELYNAALQVYPVYALSLR